MGMRPINQVNPFTCALACLECYFEETKNPCSQNEMLVQFESLLRLAAIAKPEAFGCTSDLDILEICKQRGFEAKRFRDFTLSHVEHDFNYALSVKMGVLLPA